MDLTQLRYSAVAYRAKIATVPTVGDAIEALGHLCDDLSDGFKRIMNLSAELASRDPTRVAHVEQVSI